MQAGSSTAPAQLPPDPSENELKRRYLGLLPPHQIIDICLNFELHVPQYVRHSIWPIDLKAAIAALQPKAPPQSTQSIDNEPPMASMAPPPKPTVSETPASERTNEPKKPPDPPGSRPGVSNGDTPTISSTAEPSSHETKSNPPQPQHPYHQPYGYPPGAYPHTPYYPSPPNYPYVHHTPYGYPPPPGYPHPPGYPPPPQHHPAQNPPFSGTPYAAGQTDGPTVSADDLPSYEEMIVEALVDSNDPEGWMPKQLFAWMASRYPLQSNFRPSASQALQKAFKRGRLEKNSDGKYRLNSAWEGGNTSRRTTRRPQTQNTGQVAASQPASPFTHAPLVHHSQSHSPAPQPSHPGYPGFSPTPYPGHPVHPPQPQPSQPPALPATSTPAAPSPAHDEIQEGSEAWEAAKTILKAINFKGLLSMDSGDAAKEQVAESASEPATGVLSVTSHSDAATEAAVPDVSGITVGVPEARASLQAQLALLATQLAEIAQLGEPVAPAPAPLVEGPPVDPGLEVLPDDDSDDDDMDEVAIV